MRLTFPILVLAAVMGLSGSVAAMPALPGDVGPPPLAAHDAGLVDLLGGLPPATPLQPAAAPEPVGPEPDALPLGATTPVQPLPPLPGSLFLAGFGLVCVALFRGRARLAGLLVAAASVCYAGLGSLPRLMAGAARGRVAHQAPHSDPKPVEDAARRPVGAQPDRDYVGLLHRLGTAGGDGSAALRLFPWKGEAHGGGESPRRHIPDSTRPAVRLAFAQPAAGPVFRASHILHSLVLFPDGAASRPDSASAPLPRRASSIPAGLFSSTHLFARPPPSISAGDNRPGLLRLLWLIQSR